MENKKDPLKRAFVKVRQNWFIIRKGLFPQTIKKKAQGKVIKRIVTRVSRRALHPAQR
jgi:hypothetical protein